MLSILIPEFNTDVRQLISILKNQCEASGIRYEIICLDDGSPQHVKEINRTINTWPNCVLIENESNTGRVLAREKLAQSAGGDILLFLDSDVSPARKNFISVYFLYLPIARAGKVIYGGGLPYPHSDPHHILSFMYKKYRHFAPPHKRNKKPYLFFRTDNFLIRKDIFINLWKQIPPLSLYGYEDILFALYLEANNIPVIHIDNPVFHQLKQNESFLASLEESIISLYTISSLDIPQSFRGLKALRIVNKYPLLKKILRRVWRQAGNKLKEFILSPPSSPVLTLIAIDIYRLLYAASISNMASGGRNT